MSYQPEPDHEREFPKLFALKKRVLDWKANRPVSFWLWIWFLCAFVALLTYAGQSIHQMQRPSFKVFALYAAFGWVCPLWIWVKARKDRQA
ncbi:hypothetical protein [Leisingera aquaemixtae]|uniref:hypothetical protein n=1 Tax=Leisingera aquaemixtae TaxID=1396826 RepID=UPI00071C306E|nr:hypothetical protein [Leisingera aquaemixtae]